MAHRVVCYHHYYSCTRDSCVYSGHMYCLLADNDNGNLVRYISHCLWHGAIDTS